MTLETKVEVRTSEYVDDARYIFSVGPGSESYSTWFNVYDKDLKRTVVSSVLRSDRMVEVMSSINNATVQLGLLYDRKLQRMTQDLAEIRSRVLGGTIKAIRFVYIGESLNEVPNYTHPVPCVDLRVELYQTSAPGADDVPVSTADFTIRATSEHFGMLINSFMGYNYVDSTRLSELRELITGASIIDPKIEAALCPDEGPGELNEVL